MSLTIKENNGIFLVQGSINTKTVAQFKNHLEFLLLYKKNLTIDIDGVSAIDRMGMKAIKTLNCMALTHKKSFDIVGYGCKAIYEDILESHLA